jgi:ribosomal protein S18 acetylase RimI-like enzyme
MSSPSFEIVVDANSSHLGDADLEKLICRVYVDGGFTRQEVVAKIFTAAAIRRRGKLLLARNLADKSLAGALILVAPGSPACRVAKNGEAEMQLLAVLPEHRNAGIGRGLIDAALQLARREGYSEMALRTQPTMHAAHHLYSKAGFVRAPERDVQQDDYTFLAYKRVL